jgi:hypothetical protein
MNRRLFLERLASLLSVFIANRCGLHQTPSADRTFTSTQTEGHDHSVTIPLDTLTAPPQSGHTLTTTMAFSHTHTLTLSQEQLINIYNGYAVSKETDASSHSHTFLLVLKEA